MEQTSLPGKDYSTISPSAKSLLFLKSLTGIPFAKEAAVLAMQPENYIPDYSNKDISFWARVVHFENRYWSIDRLLDDLPHKNILELSSGFSFRGLNMVKQDGVFYIDTDLPEVIETKKRFIEALKGESLNPKSKLETLSLNALDEDQFDAIINRFPEGEIVIVNEGLLMYLNTEEKERLCKIINKVLKKRGGYWITADIYVKTNQESSIFKADARLKHFLEQHRVEENKFDNLGSAKQFFETAGFIVDKEALPDYAENKRNKKIIGEYTG